jgi:alkylation response protein AidB-like acyl-CoA dehydrogenase
MNFEHTEDRRMLMDSLNRFVSEQYSADVRTQIAYGAEGHSPKLYAQLAELGTIGALFPEEVGGFAGAVLTSVWCLNAWAEASCPNLCWALCWWVVH